MMSSIPSHDGIMEGYGSGRVHDDFLVQLVSRLSTNDEYCDDFQSPSRQPLNRTNNVTDCVPVPSSEHVAEIVGRQGEFSSMLPCPLEASKFISFFAEAEGCPQLFATCHVCLQLLLHLRAVFTRIAAPFQAV